MSNWVDLWKNESWNKLQKDEKAEQFTGVIVKEQEQGMSFMQRFNPYKLKTDDGKKIDIYSGETDDLKSYVGKKVTLEGKSQKFELEGKDVFEIWPNKLKVLN